MSTILTVVVFCVLLVVSLFIIAMMLYPVANKYVKKCFFGDATRRHKSILYPLIKRLLDIIASFLLIVICSPIALAISLCIKCEDPGPIFYKQLRTRSDGKDVYAYKFRSMIVNADMMRLPRYGLDTRITKTGRILRMSRLDELPYLLSVLKGDLSFVGVDFHPSTEFHYLEEHGLPQYYTVKCGLLSPSFFVDYSYDFEAKLLLSKKYEDNFSFLLDFAMICSSVAQIVRPDVEEFKPDADTDEIQKDAE